jgi:hypothetical protein
MLEFIYKIYSRDRDWTQKIRGPNFRERAVPRRETPETKFSIRLCTLDCSKIGRAPPYSAPIWLLGRGGNFAATQSTTMLLQNSWFYYHWTLSVSDGLITFCFPETMIHGVRWSNNNPVISWTFSTPNNPNRGISSYSAVSLLGTEIWYGTELFVRTYPRARFHVTVTSVSVAHALTKPTAGRFSKEIPKRCCIFWKKDKFDFFAKSFHFQKLISPRSVVGLPWNFF